MTDLPASLFRKLLKGRTRSTTVIAGGLLILGVTNYLFLLVAGRVMSDVEYAPLGALWVLVFLAVPGFFFPIEQELSRAIASRRALDQGAGPVVRRVALLALILLGALLVLIAVTTPLTLNRLFDGNGLLYLGLVVALVGMALGYLARGFLAGNGRLSAYGLLMAVEGVSRLVLAGVLAITGIEVAGPYGILIGIGPMIGVLIALRGKRALVDPGPASSWAEASSSLTSLVAASLFAQTLANAAPLVVKFLSDATGAVVAASFTKAVILTRIPLFLFQAVQAVMLPRLTRLAVSGDYNGFRSVLRTLLGVVTLTAGLGTVGAWVAGPLLLDWFGSPGGLPRSDIVLLALGSGVYLVAMVFAQALVAVRGQRSTVAGWLSGVAAFVGVVALPGDIVTRTEIALIAGANVSALTMWVLLLARLRTAETAQ